MKIFRHPDKKRPGHQLGFSSSDMLDPLHQSISRDGSSLGTR